VVEFINFETFVEINEVCSQAITLPRIISRRGRIFIDTDRDELNIIRLGVNHIKLLPITMALKDKAITAVLIWRGSSWYENGKPIWLLIIATSVARIE